MKKILIISLILLSYQIAFSQFELKIEFLPTDDLQINSCINTDISMRAVVSNFTAFDKDKATYTWYFGNGVQESELGLENVTYAYSKGGGYYVLLRVVDEFGTIRFARKQIQIGLDPTFTETSVSTDKSICLGDRVTLSSKIRSNTWEYTYLDSIIFDEAYRLADDYPQYAQSLTFFSFTENATVENISDLEKIKINLEHSASSDLEIKIKCPNETEVILKASGGTDSYLGEPQLDPSTASGIAYDYSWSTNHSYSTMTAEALTHTTLPAGSYTSSQNLSDLVGCPLNGEWTLTILDGLSANNGYMFSWGVVFEPSLISTNWEFTNNYDKTSIIWTGTGVGLPTNLTEGETFTSNVFATPEEYGSSLYNFSVENDFSCPCDTSINVIVSAPSFTYDPLGGEAPVDITFTNETEWGNTFEWDFGDEAGYSFDENPDYTYHADNDTSYKILFTVYSEALCKDTISDIIYIKVPNSEIDLPNVFTPNSDGNNDIWIIKPKAQDKELQDVLSELDCRVYNRFGRMVCRFKTPEEAKNGWDGTLNNNGNTYVSEGIYFYRIIATGKDGNELAEEFQQGFIHVFR